MRGTRVTVFLTLTLLSIAEALILYNLGQNHANGDKAVKIKIPPRNEMLKIIGATILFSTIGTFVVSHVIKKV